MLLKVNGHNFLLDRVKCKRFSAMGRCEGDVLFVLDGQH